MASSRDLQTTPRHRWFYFKHSYSFRLVERILDTWDLPQDAVLLDNFVGSGTTLLVARNRGFGAIGFDLSPLAVIISNAKTAAYSKVQLNDHLDDILSGQSAADHPSHCIQRLRDAFSDRELQELTSIFDSAWQQPEPSRGFFLLAALSTAYDFR